MSSECINTTVCTAVDLSRSECPSEALHFFAHPSLAVYIYIFSLQVCIDGYGGLLALWQWACIYLQGTVRRTQSDEIGQALLQIPPCAWRAIR